VGHYYPALPVTDAQVARLPLIPDTLNMALLSAQHPLAGREVIRLRDLANVPFLFMKRSFSPEFYDQIMSGFSQAGFTPRIEVEHDGLPTVWALAAQQMGWCLGSESLREYPPTGLKAVRLADFGLPWGVEVAYHRSESRPAVLTILTLLKDAAQRIQDESMASQETKYWPQVALTG
jgi:DNA-binding transcriptional LysR family regulator